MAKYQKRLVVVDAEQLTEDRSYGQQTGAPGDWEITLPDGEKYPVPREKFELLYEPLRDTITVAARDRHVTGHVGETPSVG